MFVPISTAPHPFICSTLHVIYVYVMPISMPIVFVLISIVFILMSDIPSIPSPHYLLSHLYLPVLSAIHVSNVSA